jgi:Na+-driven multidrug efflux pump
MMIPAVVNIVLDPVFIIVLDWGLEGAAWATTISYYMSAAFTSWFFFLGPSELSLTWGRMRPEWELVREITSIGFVTLARQGTVSLLTIVLNHSLFAYGDELAIAIFGVINRIMMFANFPVLGITQGFLPIAGFNYGAQYWLRVRDTIRISILSGTAISLLLLTGILLFARPAVGLFTTDPALLKPTPRALKIVFMAIPLIPAQLIGAAYFQAIGKALPALLLTMTKQGFFLIPLVLILPLFFDLDGIWYAFPLSDILAATVTLTYLLWEIRGKLTPQIEHNPVAEVIQE